jgi:hypothetical protein
VGFGPADAVTSQADAAFLLVKVLAGPRLTAGLLQPPFTTMVPYLAGSPTSCRTAEVSPGLRDQTRSATNMHAAPIHEVDTDTAVHDWQETRTHGAPS